MVVCLAMVVVGGHPTKTNDAKTINGLSSLDRDLKMQRNCKI